jgi:putative tryptophan/tyrosine transport system substrate-binding protein
MRRREFITLFGSAASTWPLAARAQQRPGQIRRIGVLMTTAADDARGQVWYAAFVQGLQQLGWEVGANARIDIRWGAGTHFPNTRLRKEPSSSQSIGRYLRHL